MMRHFDAADISLIEQDFKNEVLKRGFKKVVFGLSGGLDSAVVAALAARSFKDSLALILPSTHSNEENIKDALSLCANVGLRHELVYLHDFEASYRTLNERGGGDDLLRYGNFCSRIRMNIIFDRSAREGALVSGASNKSEIILGYGTLFGDLAYGFNPLHPYFKSEIFNLASSLNIPERIIKKPPSADLYPNQVDKNEIGYEYLQLDPLLSAIENGGINILKSKEGSSKECMKNYREEYSLFNIISTAMAHMHELNLGDKFDQKMVENITSRIKKNLFKLQYLPK